MRNFGGALGSLWPASGTLARAGLAGATYGMMFRKNDQFFGEMFGLEGYRERDFWEKVWYVFNPARAARDGGLAALLQSVISGPVGSPEPEAQAGAEGLMLPGPAPEANALVPGGDVSQADLDGGTGERALPGTGAVNTRNILNVNSKADALNSVDDLPPNIQSGVKSFFKRGSNSYVDFSVEQTENGNYIARMTKPKNVPGSKAIYYKTIDYNGNTVKVYKETYDSTGNLIHIKDK